MELSVTRRPPSGRESSRGLVNQGLKSLATIVRPLGGGHVQTRNVVSLYNGASWWPCATAQLGGHVLLFTCGQVQRRASVGRYTAQLSAFACS